MRPRHEDQPRRLTSDTAVVAVVFATFFYKLAPTVADPDLWGHVRFGLDHLEAGVLARWDSYSYTSGAQAWTNHEWLSELIFAGAYRWFGPTGLVALKLVCDVTLLGLVYRHLVRRALTPLRAGIVLLPGFVPLSVGLGTVRPQLFTYLAFTVLLLAIEAADRGRWRWLWALPPVFLAWANLHGGFLAGAAVLVAWCAAHFALKLTRSRRPDHPPARFLVGCVAASLLATLINPYGLRLWEFLLRTALVARPEITELGPVSPFTVEGSLYWVLLAVTGLALVRPVSERSVPLLVLYAMIAPLPLLAQRHLPLFVLGALVLAAGPIGAAWPDASGARRAAGARWLRASLAATALFILGLAVTRLNGVVIDGAHHPMPARAVAVLKASATRGNLAVFFDWGEYALWHLQPDFKVSWDGRRETVYDEEAHRLNLRFFSGAASWDDLLDRGTDVVLTPTTAPVYDLLRGTESWSLIYEDALAAIFSRSGSTHARAIAAVQPPALPPDGDGLPFP